MDWQSELTHLGMVALAGALGAIVGLEREVSDKPAGLKTHILVAAGSALLVVLGRGMLETYQDDEGLVQSDPIRMIQAIVIGISFLGAGTIIHQANNTVEGLTTAASIFVTTGVGIATATGHLILAAGSALFAALVLALVAWGERRMQQRMAKPPQNAANTEWAARRRSLR
ncbi:MAG: MgtC/SapB family protein [Planctomycetota bacterium]|nr:MAG: MgtC/SapB family protein [Planctomycetota bacterium]